jgi:hypothetical protein
MPRLLSFTASRTLIDVGAPTLISAVATGGSGPVTYLYSPLPTGCPAVNASSFLCTPQTAGVTTITLRVYDVFGVSAHGSLTLTVRPLPTISAFTTAPGTITEGVATTLGVTVANGVGPFTYVYSGLPAGCSTANGSRLNCTAAAAGYYHLTVSVTDADGAHAVGHTVLTVNPPPRVTAFTATPATLVLGNTTELVVTTAGGTGAVRFLYASLPPGCTTGNRSSLSCTPNLVGNYSVRVTITDSFGVEDNGSVSVAVTNPAPVPVSIGGSPSGGLGTLALVAVILIVAVALGTIGAVLWSRRRAPADRPDPTAPESSARSEGPPPDGAS